MSYVPDIQPALPVHNPDRLCSGTAVFEMSWPQQSTAMVTVQGELDAANGIPFVEFTLRCSARADRLVIDLSGLSFFAIAGLNALHTLNAHCAGNDIRCAVASGPAVDRLLVICAPDPSLLVCPDAAEALATVNNESPRLLKLVAEPS